MLFTMFFNCKIIYLFFRFFEHFRLNIGTSIYIVLQSMCLLCECKKNGETPDQMNFLYFTCNESRYMVSATFCDKHIYYIKTHTFAVYIASLERDRAAALASFSGGARKDEICIHRA